MNHYDQTTREIHGHTVTVNWHYDDMSGMSEPWKESDGHGPVSEWTTRDKAPGELVLCSDRGMKRYYDYAEAVRLARKDGWDAKPYNTGHETKGQQAAKAALADYEYLRRWCNNDWHYIGYTVEIEGFNYPDGSLWGIESDSMREMQEEAFADAERWLANELVESADAATRDIATV